MWNSVFNHRPMGPLEDICSSLLHGYILSRTLNIAATLDYVNSDICFLISKTLVLLGFLLPVLGLEVSSRLKTGATAHFLSLRYQPMLPGLQYLAELFLLTFLTPKMWAAFFPPPHQPTLQLSGYQLDVIRFRSILTLMAGSSHSSHKNSEVSCKS